MKRVIEYNVLREIEYIEVEESETGICCAFRETETIGDSVSIREGIALKSELDSTDSSVKIPHSKYFLYKPEIDDVIRKIPFSFKCFDKMVEDVRIEKPYTYLTEQGNDVRLYNISYYDYFIYDADGKNVPCAVYFDYMNARMDNSNFDLEYVLSVLTKRDDILFVEKFQSDGHVLASEPKIKEIPYYNRDEERNQFLQFVWVPKKEDYDIVLKNSKSRLNMFDSIYGDIFKIERLKK